jgi:two-component system cell cycle response regulator
MTSNSNFPLKFIHKGEVTDGKHYYNYTRIYFKSDIFSKNKADLCEESVMRVLITDDGHGTSQNLAENISSWGFDTIMARNEQEAWSIIEKKDIRLAVLDRTMQGIDVLKLCKKIRQTQTGEICKYIYIILLAERKQHEDIIAGLSSGADDYMVKPPDLLELKVRLLNGIRIIELEDKHIKLACFDSLTNIWNRNKIFEFLEEELERQSRMNQETGIIMIDIDNFKLVNDTHGHYIGDVVLAEVASLLKASIRLYDKIGRYGGDEFLIVLPNCNQTDIAKVSERLRHKIMKKKIKTDEGDLSITISIGGVTSQSLSKLTLKNFLQASDDALYLAKKHGRNCTVVN